MTFNNGGAAAINLIGGGIQTITSPLVFTDPLTASIADQLTISGNISGSSLSLTNNAGNPGTLTLSGTNTYSATNLAGGATLSVSSGGNVGSGAITFTGNSNFLISAAGATFANSIKINSGIVGTLRPNYANSTTSTISGAITDGTGSGNLAVGTVFDDGILALTGTNTYTGGTQIGGGAVSINSNNNLGTGGLTFTNSGELQFSAATTCSTPILINSGVTAFIDPTTFDCELSGQITGGSASSVLTVGTAGTTGTLLLSNPGNSSTAWILTLEGGVVAINSGNNLPSPSGSVNLFINTPTLQFNMPLTCTTPLTLHGGNICTINTQGNDSTVSSIISEAFGTGTLQKNGSGQLTLSATNTYSGGTLINDGTVSIGAPANLGSGQVTFVNNSSLQLNTAQTFTLALNIDMGTTAIFDTDGQDSTISNTITGVGSGTVLQKNGAGVLTLGNSSNMYSATNIKQGTIAIASESALGGSTPVTFIGDSALQLQGVTGFSTAISIDNIGHSYNRYAIEFIDHKRHHRDGDDDAAKNRSGNPDLI